MKKIILTIGIVFTSLINAQTSKEDYDYLKEKFPINQNENVGISQNEKNFIDIGSISFGDNEKFTFYSFIDDENIVKAVISKHNYIGKKSGNKINYFRIIPIKNLELSLQTEKESNYSFRNKKEKELYDLAVKMFFLDYNVQVITDHKLKM